MSSNPPQGSSMDANSSDLRQEEDHWKINMECPPLIKMLVIW
jgi:hypothetical protein